MSYNRQTLLNAVVARVSEVEGLKSVLAKPRLQASIPPSEQPVAIVRLADEVADSTTGAGTIFTVQFVIGIGVHDTSPAGPLPVLLPLVQAVEEAIESSRLDEGYLAELQGPREYDFTGDAYASAVITIEVTVKG